VKHRGNIKAALRDGVLVAKVVAQKLKGAKEFDIEIDFENQPPAAPPPEKAKHVSVVRTIMETLTPAAAPAQAALPAVGISLLRKSANGTEEEFVVKADGVTTIGRKFCDIVFPDDEFLSERHASISSLGGVYVLRDEASATGAFLKLREGIAREIASGDLIRLGKQFLLLSVTGSEAALIHFNASGKEIGKHLLSPRTIVVGREAPDVTLDAADATLSRRHLSVTMKEGKVSVKDLKSVNGTYLRVRDEVKLAGDDEFRIGRQNFQFRISEEPQKEVVRIVPKPAPSQADVPAKTAPAAKIPAPQPPPPAGNMIRFANTGLSVPFVGGQTICDIAEKNSLKIVAECHAGICGSDPIRVLSGQERLSPITDDEKGTLEDICGLVPGECRLACMAKPAGPVEVEILKP
jgi:pSer/pThr/pTyr-binding forkhead associated (FHA) protein/ferredoxin